MADSTTTRYGYVKPEVGASADTWGAKLNTNLDDVDAIGGAITTTGSADAYVLTTSLSLAAYVAGQSFDIKANFTNGGAATIAVDGLAAKDIRKNGTTALAAGDIVSGNIYRISYDGTLFQVIGGGNFQPLDATLTALAALSWASGNALVQFTAADTVSLTLTPSVTSVTATTTVAATHGVTAKNTTDAASVAALRIEGDRATPATNDEVYASWYLSDSAGNQDEFMRWTASGSDVSSGSEDAIGILSLVVAGSLTSCYRLSPTIFRPTNNDGAALGTTTVGWSDYHAATGHTWNVANGNWVLTHSSGQAEVTTGAFAARAVQVTGVGGETLAAATHRNRVLLLDGDITLPNATFTAGDWHVFQCDGTNRTITRGASVTMYVNGVDSATATIPARTTGGAAWETASVVHLTGPIF